MIALPERFSLVVVGTLVSLAPSLARAQPVSPPGPNDHVIMNSIPDPLNNTNYNGVSASFRGSQQPGNWQITGQRVDPQPTAYEVIGIRTVVGASALNPHFFDFPNYFTKEHITMWLGDPWGGQASPFVGAANFERPSSPQNYTLLGDSGLSASFYTGRDGLSFIVPANTPLWVSCWWETPGITYGETAVGMTPSDHFDGMRAIYNTFGGYSEIQISAALTVIGVVPAPGATAVLAVGCAALVRRRRRA